MFFFVSGKISISLNEKMTWGQGFQSTLTGKISQKLISLTVVTRQ